MRKYVAELIGTFALVFCGTGAIIINQETNGGVTHVGIAITFGLIVMAMIYALGNISGAHLNPQLRLPLRYQADSFLRKLFLISSARLVVRCWPVLFFIFYSRPMNCSAQQCRRVAQPNHSFLNYYLLSF